MPSRPRSHVVETQSKDWFRTAMYPEWIVRDKTDDYGVDCEAERLVEGDGRTGDMFYVQLKATDDAKKARTVRIGVDRLDYLLSFEVPGIVVRYCAATKEAYWMWAEEARGRAQSGAETVTVRFEDHHVWHDGTVAEIEHSVRLRAILKCGDHRTGFPLRVVMTTSHAQGMIIRQVADRVRRAAPVFGAGMFQVPLVLDIRDRDVEVHIMRGVSCRTAAASKDIDDRQQPSSTPRLLF